MSEKNYRAFGVYGGWVTSAADGQRHNLSAYQVARLYGLTSRAQPHAWVNLSSHPRALGLRRGELIIVGPRSDGDYDLDKRIAEWDYDKRLREIDPEKFRRLMTGDWE